MKILYHYKKKLNKYLKNKEYLSSTLNNYINLKLHIKNLQSVYNILDKNN
jgi:hypothetical protein